MSKSFEIQFSGDAAVFSELISYVLEHRSDALIELRADLAGGKTTLANAFIRELCGAAGSSPTYLKMSEYDIADAQRAGACKLYHYDFYALDEGEQFKALFENLFQDGLHLIEWLPAEFKSRLERYGIGILVIQITPCNEGRIYKIFKENE